jgi:endonuclease III
MTINIDIVYPLLKEEVVEYDVPVVDLIAVQTRDPFKVLIATILSARTKDETTAKASARLFKKVSDLESLARLDEQTISRLIYPVGFYKNKAKYLKELPAAMKQFDNRIPDDIESLVKLPGVGRKTANLVVVLIPMSTGL